MESEIILDELTKRVRLLKQRKLASDISVSQYQCTIEELEHLIEFVNSKKVIKSRQ